MIANCAAASTTHILHIGKATEGKKTAGHGKNVISLHICHLFLQVSSHFTDEIPD